MSEEKNNLSRRKFLGAGAAAGSVVAGGILGGGLLASGKTVAATNTPPFNQACLASLSAPQTIPSGFGGPGGYLVNLDYAVLDPFNIFDPATHLIRLPLSAQFVQVIAHVTIQCPPAGSNPGFGAIHIFRDGAPTNDVYYHNKVYLPAYGSGNSSVSIMTMTPWVPVMYNENQGYGEFWTLLVHQTTGQPLNLIDDGSGEENWLAVNWV